MKKLLKLVVLLCLIYATADAGGAQRRPSPPGPHIFTPVPQSPDEIKRQKDLQKGMNKERAKEIKAEADTLLQLATELKKSVDATTENVLSLEVIRKTEEIEKLAKKVRDKMKETYVPVDSVGLPDASRGR